MISRWKAALIFSPALLLASVGAAAPVIRSVAVSGNSMISASEIARGSLLRSGTPFSDSLVSLEVARIDSLYFSIGVLSVGMRADTIRRGDGVDLLLRVEEGAPARVGRVAVSGAALLGEERAREAIRPREGDPFDPFLLERSLGALLARYNESGYPYAQVWLTGFAYRADSNEVDLVVSISEAERTAIGRIVFEGLAKTDSSVARRTSRLRPGTLYRSTDVERARAYLRSSGLFESVGEARLERRRAGEIDLVLPVKETKGAGSFQGAMGVSKKADGSYVASGAAGLILRNIAGSGRDAALDWLNDGQSYSRIGIRFREPFVASTPLSLGIELSQIVQDSVYVWSAGALSVGIPLGPAATVTAGLAADRNVPETGELARSTRQRFRVGYARTGAGFASAAIHVEGAYRKKYFSNAPAERDGELLYGFDASASVATFESQSLYLRLASQGVFAKGDVPLAETYALGGANTLRGYREAQFRGEKIVWSSVEYRFGAGGLFFLFDDVGAFETRREGWTFKNGVGFGLRADSPVGIVSLSFGVGERLSLAETRLHVSLSERF